MKGYKLLLLLLVVILLCSACTPNCEDISAVEIIEAYEAAGYQVAFGEYDEAMDLGQIGYIQATYPNGDYIYFSIFESKEAAQTYKDEFYHPGMISLFSVILGDPSWPRWKVHGCIVAEYHDPDRYEIFKTILEKQMSS